MSATFDTGLLFYWMLALFRAGALFLMLPFFSGNVPPRTVRVAMAALLAWMVVPDAGDPGIARAYPADMLALILIVAKESVVGLMMGMAVRFAFATIEFAAHILAVEVSLNPPPEIDPTANAAGNPLGTGLFYLGVVILFAGGHYAIFYAFVRSFELVPIGLQVPEIGFVGVAVKHTARIFLLGTLMAAPVIAVNFLVNLAFSILGRVVPKMNVFILSFSVRILAGLGMVVLASGLIAHYILQQFGDVPELMLRLMPFGGF